MKKMTQLLTSILVICFAWLSSAQDVNCGTELNLTESEKQEVIKTMQTDFVEFRNNLSEQPTPPIVVPIQIHIVSTTAGTGGVSETVVFNEIANQVNPKYASIEMTFVPVGPTNYINSDTYYNISGKPEGQQMSVANSIPNVLNIYFVNDPDGACGWARFSSSLPEDYIVIANSCANNTSTLAHEIGHYFDLYHTHETAFGNELVNGSNCAGAGDLLCDTPADPRLTSLVTAFPGCAYTGTSSDSNGDTYIPDPSQVMSYSQKQCRVNFSSEAENKILFTVQNARCYLFNNLNVIEEVCLSNGIQTDLSGGTPFGGQYSGLGVTDNADGETYTLDPSIAGTGILTITYTVESICGPTEIFTDDINITNTPPAIICYGSGILMSYGEETSSPGAVITDSAPVTSVITVSDNQIITDLNIDLEIPHTWVGDILISLESPDGTVVTIFDVGPGCSGDNLITTLDDEASTTSSVCYGAGTFEAYPNTSYQPFAPLSAFDGESTAGNWILIVTDTAGGDDGTLISWAINYEYEIVSSPLSVSLDATGLATVNAEDLIYSATTDCGGYSILAGDVPAATVSFTCKDVGSNAVNIIVTNDAGASSICTAIVLVGDSVSCSPIALSPKVYIQGATLNPNIGEETLMRDDLRVSSLLPTTSPYADALTCDISVFSTTGINAVVDWVWVELRDSLSNTTIVDSQSALLLRNGLVVGVDGFSNLEFGQPAGDYYVVINHRNHLGIMTSATVNLSSEVTIVDFTNANNLITYGSNAQTTSGMPVNIVGLWAGNVDADKTVQYIGANPDSPSILSNILNDVGNVLNFPTYIVSGYNDNDVNLNGETQYIGANPETPFILQNVQSHSGNFLNLSTYSIEEQLP